MKQQWDGKGKLRPEDRDKLEQVVQTQKDIQNKVGSTKDEGMRALLENLKQMLKDNNMPSSGDKDRINAIGNEVERLATDPLPKILDELKNPPPKKEFPEGKKDRPRRNSRGSSPRPRATRTRCTSRWTNC